MMVQSWEEVQLQPWVIHSIQTELQHVSSSSCRNKMGQKPQRQTPKYPHAAAPHFNWRQQTHTCVSVYGSAASHYLGLLF